MSDPATENTTTTATQTTDDDDEITVTLTVEDGTCVSGANSYVSLAEATTYHTNKNRTDWLALTDNEKKASLIKATQYIDSVYNWKGRQFRPLAQELCFPRVEIYVQGTEVKGIPSALKKAVFEASYYSMSEELFSVHKSESGVIKRELNRVKGISEVTGAVKKEDETETEYEYFDNDEHESDYVSRYSSLDSILKGLYVPKNAKASVNAVASWRM